jgi:hypothetical protein
MAFLIALAVIPPLWLWRRRTRVWKAWAKQHGWTYQRKDERTPLRWVRTQLDSAFRRPALHRVAGWFNGRPACAFTYRFTEVTDLSVIGWFRILTFGVCVLVLPMALPSLELHPRRGPKFVRRLLASGEILFDSEEFNLSWRVRSRRASYARSLITPQFMAMLQEPSFPRVTYRFDGHDLVAWRSRRLKPKDVSPRMEALADVMAAIPVDIWERYGRPQA